MANEVASRAVRRARKRGASPRVVKALVEAGMVESNLTHLQGGDRDSTGFLQQRPSQGWGPVGESVEKDTDQFLAHAMKLNKGFKGSAGQLAQAVQRSAFPGRYDQRGGEAEALIRRLGGGSPTRSSGGATTSTKTIPGQDRSGERRQMLASYLLSQEQHKPDGLLNLRAQLDTAQDTPAKVSVTRRTGTPSSGAKSGGGTTNIRQLMRVAQRDFGLNVGENSLYDKVDPVHAEGSYHYQKTAGGTDAAADISGPPDKMAAFARYVARNYGKDVEELIWRGKSARTIKKGKRVPKDFFTGHTDHVHVADIDT